MSKTKSLKGFFMTTFFIGLGFFTMGLMDPLYDTYVPIFLGRYLTHNSLIGLVMTLDNLLAIFLIPVFSALSDNVDTPIGRRMPFIITLLPLTAVVFGLLPFAALTSFGFLVLLIFVLNIVKQAVRGPVVALMPDMVPPDLRSEANGVINMMGGLATILGTVLLARLMDIKVTLPGIGSTNNVLAFPVASLFVLLATILLFFFVKEKKSKVNASEKGEKEEEKKGIGESLHAVLHEKNRSALFILFSLFCWFMAYQGVLPFIGKYSIEVLHTSSGTASLAAGMVGIAYAVFAIPSGRIAHRFGRKRTIRICLVALVVVLMLIFVQGKGIKGDALSATLYLFWVLLFLFGIFWVSVVTNSFPMLWQMSDFQTVGIYTGLYYFFSQLASVLSPPLFGLVIDLFGYAALFALAALFMAIAFFLMRHVDRGEPEDASLATKA